MEKVLHSKISQVRFWHFDKNFNIFTKKYLMLSLVKCVEEKLTIFFCQKSLSLTITDSDTIVFMATFYYRIVHLKLLQK